MTKYADLEIKLNHHQNNDYDVHLRFTQADEGLDTPLITETHNVTLDFKGIETHSLNPERYGQSLYKTLFANPALEKTFDKALTLAKSHAETLLVRFFIERNAIKLHALRWETLCDPQDNSYLFTHENLICSRYLTTSEVRPFRPQARADLKALVVIANPSDLDPEQLAPVDVKSELDRARSSLGDIPLMQLASQGQATLSAIKTGLREGCQILYLVCHGAMEEEGAVLWLEQKDGCAAVTSGQALLNGLKELNQPPLLVVLASCQSAGPGQSIPTQDQGTLAALGSQLARAGIPSVLAMQGNITQTTVAEFMPTFFRELQQDGQIDRAVAIARGQVREQNRPDWWMPVLFTRSKSGRLWVDDSSGLPISATTRLPFEPEVVQIPAGDFIMGTDEGQAYETPPHNVKLAAYKIGKFPVTHAQYAEFIKQTGASISPKAGWELARVGQAPPEDKLNHPLVGISWDEAVVYCRWLSEQTGRNYRLPSEAEWEKAARGALDKRVYPWGQSWENQRANQNGQNTTPVDQYPEQSPYGCYDLVGNVWEWTSTIWGSERAEPDFVYPYPAPHQPDGREAPPTDHALHREYRLCRGGSFRDKPARLSCSARARFAADTPHARRGFRVVQEL